tara:strand:- start:1638 stop:2699 length:1062 start_codon:yes stop_codon:yes gene_type:complete
MNYLTSIRGIAAFFVVLYHIKHWLVAYNVPQFISIFFEKGYLAVDFFFLLSGFIISFNYMKHFSSNDTWQAKKVFIIKRIARIYPLHVFVLLSYLSIPLALYLTNRVVPEGAFTAESFFIKLMLLDLWFISSDFWSMWNTPSWTISGEFCAYLAFAFTAGFIAKFRRYAVIALLVSLSITAIAYTVIGARSLGDNIGDLGLLRCVFGFFNGMCLYIIYYRLKDKEIAFGKWLFCISFLSFYGLILTTTANHFYAPGLFFCMLLGLLLSKGPIHRLLELKPFIWLGDISYSVYLSHTFLLNWFVMLLMEDSHNASIFNIFAYIAIVLMFSTMCYRLVEVPGRRLISRKFTNKGS